MSQKSPSKTQTNHKDKESAKEKDAKLYQLPLARIKTIMKSCPDASGISTDALFMVCKSTELFLQYFAQKAHQNKGKTLDYKHLANAVDNEDNLDFLSAICPKKITVREYKAILAKQKDDSDSSDEDEAEEEEDNGDNESGDSGGESSGEEKEEVVEISDSSEDDPKKTKAKPKSGK